MEGTPFRSVAKRQGERSRVNLKRVHLYRPKQWLSGWSTESRPVRCQVTIVAGGVPTKEPRLFTPRLKTRTAAKQPTRRRKKRHSATTRSARRCDIIKLSYYLHPIRTPWGKHSARSRPLEQLGPTKCWQLSHN